MFYNFTPAVERALEAAQRYARAAGHSEVHPRHLLAGLLHEEEGRAALLLAKARLDLSTWRKSFARLEDGASSVGPLMPLGSQTQQALNHAHELAIESSPDRVVASEQVLVALVRCDKDLRALLEEHGLAPGQLEAAVVYPAPTPLPLDEPVAITESVDDSAVARILDADANRSREALRVIEDYCRFSLDDAFLTSECKAMRHRLTESLNTLPAKLLIAARDTVHDVGTGIFTPTERERSSLVHVVQANCKRLQEALRSLEEYGKIHGGEFGQAVEQLRYFSYTLERAVLFGTSARQRLADARLYILVTGAECAAALDWTIKEAADGGAQVVQLREKNLSDRELLDRARKVRRWTREAGVLFIMNDRPDMALLAEADGVHVGQDELPVREVRRVVGPDALIGVSTHDIDQVRRAVLDGASYIGVGPTFPSGTKEFDEFPGLEFARQAVRETSLPAFVIGGISLENIDEVIEAGGQRVAVSRALCQAEEPRQVAATLREALEAAAKEKVG